MKPCERLGELVNYSQGLGVQKKGMKVQRGGGGGGKRVAVAAVGTRKPGKGRQSTQKAAAAPR